MFGFKVDAKCFDIYCALKCDLHLILCSFHGIYFHKLVVSDEGLEPWFDFSAPNCKIERIRVGVWFKC